MQTGAETERTIIVPDWIPDEVKRYVAHTEHGRSIRERCFDPGECIHAKSKV